MLISIVRYTQGYLRIRVNGYSPERFLNLCKNKGIEVWGLISGHNYYEMYMKVSGFRKLKPIIRKTQTKVTIEERFGLPFFFYRYRKRTLFWGGGLIALVLILCLTFFVWDIKFEGNQMITDDVLMEFLDINEIKHGIPLYKVNCEQIAKDIRQEFDDIIWVSAYVEGTRLTIEVKENTDTFEIESEESEPSDLISNKSGVVRSIITRNGVPQVKAGDIVEDGMLLVTGTVEVLNDAKEVTGYHYVSADADVVLERVEIYTDSIQKKYQKKIYTDNKRKLYLVKIGDYTFHFGISKNKFEKKSYHSEQTQLKIGENFYLPIIIGSYQIREYDLEILEYSQEEMEKLLQDRFEQYCKELEYAGAVIVAKNIRFFHDQNGAYANGTIELTEEVGITRKIVDFLQKPMVE